jgi:hypothetical protein
MDVHDISIHERISSELATRWISGKCRTRGATRGKCASSLVPQIFSTCLPKVFGMQQLAAWWWSEMTHLDDLDVVEMRHVAEMLHHPPLTCR